MERKQTHPQQLPLPLEMNGSQTTRETVTQGSQAAIVQALSRLILQVARAQRAQVAVAKESTDERS